MARLLTRQLGAPIMAGAILLATAGCGSRYIAPPAALVNSSANPGTGSQPIVVVGRFDDPDPVVVPIKDVGSELANALGRMLARDSDIEVWFDPGIGQTVSGIVDGSAGQRAAAFNQLRRKHQRVRFIVLGQVTDFRHVREDPRNFIERWFVGRKQKALVAIEFQVIDILEERRVLTHHVLATEKAPDKPVREVYGDVVSNSYLFWNTPLGQAGAAAVLSASEIIDSSGAIVSAESEIRVVSLPDARRLRISSGGRRPIRKGDYYVCRYRLSDGRLEAVVDAHTRRPLQASVKTGGRGSSIAWLLGRAEPDVNLRGAVLVPDLPLSDSTVVPEHGPELARTGAAASSP